MCISQDVREYVPAEYGREVDKVRGAGLLCLCGRRPLNPGAMTGPTTAVDIGRRTSAADAGVIVSVSARCGEVRLAQQPAAALLGLLR